jgi:small GTP-binding protein
MDISALMGLRKLRKLALVGNQITELPREIVDSGMEIRWEEWDYDKGGIFLEDNPLESPPIEVVERGCGAVIEYFKSLEGEKLLPLNEVKVLLVGHGGAGKTCLVKRLLGEGYDKNEKQTHGINIRDWEVKEEGKKIDVHFWDFGGQEIMHATHQFFLSKRSLYVLVLDGRKDEDAEYWLKHIESFGGDSPVLVVMNKIDENAGFDVNRRFLREKYKGIKDFQRVSCAENKGIAAFKKSLKKELGQVELLKSTWARSWFNVKKYLDKMSENFISYDEYKRICGKEGITEKQAQETLVDYLNDLGVVVHFHEFELEDTHVLEPRWITGAVYKIVNSDKLADSKGILRLGWLDEILKKRRKVDYVYPHDKYKYIIDLMQKFELCYAIDAKRVLVPDLLEVQQPEFDFDYDGCLRFVFEYDFQPRSVMPRFIVRMHGNIKGELRWRTGVVLEDEGFHSTAVVKGDETDKRIYVYVSGEQKRDYFSVIRKAFRDINDSFERLEVRELVPLPDNTEVSVEYEELIGHELGRKGEIYVGKLRKGYSVAALLDGIEKPDERAGRYERESRKGDIHIQMIQKVDQKVDVDVNVNVEIRNEITGLVNTLGNMKEDMLDEVDEAEREKLESWADGEERGGEIIAGDGPAEAVY